jgi:hypothetical protein
MLSIGTFGMREEGKRVKSCGRLDELSKLQEELKSLAGARRGAAIATAGELGGKSHAARAAPELFFYLEEWWNW